MFYRLKSATVIGIDASIIEIEVDLKKGLPAQSIVGLPDPAVREAKERVNSAIRNSGFEFPLGSIIVNLAPANLKKVGSVFDLAIAIGILTVSEAIKIQATMDSFLIVGELSLDGFVRPVRGILAILQKAREEGIKNIILPAGNSEEARLFSWCSLYPVNYLCEAVAIVCGYEEEREFSELSPACGVADGKTDVNVSHLIDDEKQGQDSSFDVDYSDVKGQNYVIRAVEIAAAGGHNLLLIGSPGSGKTMIASRIPTILPDMSEEESIETTKIYSISGLLIPKEGLIRKRPFRAPHHTASEISIIGGGKNPIPGEVTLSHNGVLFLDEFTEFKSNIIQSLRQPLENGFINIARADSRVTFPAAFMLVASMNPCPCGYLFDSEKICRCSQRHINKYFMKLSGPMLDRIDIQVEVKPLKAFEIVRGKPSEASEKIRERVIEAQRIQRGRCNMLNAAMTSEHIKRYCTINEEVRKLLYTAVDKYKLSTRSYYKLLKVARTIADIDKRERIIEGDILEVLSYREVENILYRKPMQKVALCV